MSNIEQIKNDEVPYELLFLADEDDNQILKYINTATFWGYFKENEIIGVVGVVSSNESIEIVNIAVRQESQNKGIGRSLIERCINEAKNRNMKTIVIKTGNSSINQLCLYQKYGFRFDTINKDYMLKNYSSPIFENGIQCIDQIVLKLDLNTNE